MKRHGKNQGLRVVSREMKQILQPPTKSITSSLIGGTGLRVHHRRRRYRPPLRPPLRSRQNISRTYHNPHILQPILPTSSPFHKQSPNQHYLRKQPS
jgi:hypothetical protein